MAGPKRGRLRLGLEKLMVWGRRRCSAGGFEVVHDQHVSGCQRVNRQQRTLCMGKDSLDLRVGALRMWMFDVVHLLPGLVVR